MAVVTIGDLHFNEDRPWGIETGDATIELIANHSLNSPENICILLGDLTEKAMFSGLIFDQLIKLFSSLKFKETYILVGNHDMKMNKMGKPTLTYQFLRSKKNQKTFPNIQIVQDPSVMTLEDMKILFLPWLNNDLQQYEHLSSELADQEYFLTVGHFADDSVDSYPGELLDINYLKTKYWSFGHIHKPSARYCGSLVPNSSAEAGEKRQIRVYTKEKGQEILYIDPICDYFMVKYPDPLPKTTCPIPIYTVLNCKDENIARSHYGNIYIRKCIYEISTDMSAFDELSSSLDRTNGKLSVLDLFDEYKKGSKFSPEVIELSRGYLTWSQA